MLVTLSGIVIELKLVQDSNALSPILVTLDGSMIETKLGILLNAFMLMLVTLAGIVTFWMTVFPDPLAKKALLPILVTL